LRHPAPDAPIRRLGKLTFIFFYSTKSKQKQKRNKKKNIIHLEGDFTFTKILGSSTKLTFARLLVFGIKNVL
jgi:hypothetical protein